MGGPWSPLIVQGGIITTIILSLHNSTIPTQQGYNELLMFLTEDDIETTKEERIIES